MGAILDPLGGDKAWGTLRDSGQSGFVTFSIGKHYPQQCSLFSSLYKA